MIRDFHTPQWQTTMVTRRRRRFPRLSRLLKGLLVLLVIGGASAGIWEVYRAVIRLPYFWVAEVQVEGNLQVATQDIVGSLRLAPKTSILQVDLKALARRVLQNPWIKEASVQRRLPLSLTIQVVERIPEAVFIADRRYLLSADGVILAELGEGELPSLPVLRAATPRHVGVGEQILTSEMVQGLSVWRQFQLANALQGERAHEILMASDGSYVVSLGQGMPAIRLHATELEGQLRRLGAALAASHQGLERFADVDLRFRDRVVFRLAAASTARR